MQIRVRLIGAFRIERFKEEIREVASESRVQQIVDELQISNRILGIVLINGVHAGVEDILQDGDTLSLLPILGGG